MKKSLDKGRMIIGILYAFGLVGMLSILLVIGISRQEETKNESDALESVPGEVIYANTIFIGNRRGLHHGQNSGHR